MRMLDGEHSYSLSCLPTIMATLEEHSSQITSIHLQPLSFALQDERPHPLLANVSHYFTSTSSGDCRGRAIVLRRDVVLVMLVLVMLMLLSLARRRPATVAVEMLPRPVSGRASFCSSSDSSLSCSTFRIARGESATLRRLVAYVFVAFPRDVKSSLLPAGRSFSAPDARGGREAGVDDNEARGEAAASALCGARAVRIGCAPCRRWAGSGLGFENTGMSDCLATRR